MPILNMVWWWSKWGNIWEPLNLTVTTSWLDATITWEDNEIWTIPPTSFAKSELVRKIGSAPTSPSDWTLVVTETVKDTYKNTGYTDSWLTDGETYYYRVFSYSDLGGISYCDAVNVTPSNPWQPWANTLAYYHIEVDDDTTIHDRAGNNDLTYTSNAYITDADAGKVMNFASTNYASWNTVNMGTEYTEIAWVYWNWGGWTQSIFTQNASSSRRPSSWIDIENWNLVALSNGNYQTNIPMPQWAWTMIWWTRNSNWDMKLYLNWVYQTTVSNTSTPDYSSWEWLYIWLWRLTYYEVDWYFKTLILEDKERDASEVSSYYDQTKWDYWIS
jgi:hypothetical protein